MLYTAIRSSNDNGETELALRLVSYVTGSKDLQQKIGLVLSKGINYVLIRL